MLPTPAVPPPSAAVTHPPRGREVKRALKTGCYAGLAITGRIAAGSGRPDPALRVLMYHKVSRHRGNTVAVSPETFRTQLQLITSRYTAVSADDVDAAVRGERALPPRAVLLTFDDGYRDNLENAYPILKEFGLSAILFPATGYLGTDRVLPHDEEVAAPNPVLTWDELSRLTDVFEIGSHGVSHRVLTRLPLDQAREEIVRSKQELEDRLGLPVRFFSYPKGSLGDYSTALEETVTSAGYQCSFTTIPGGNTAAHVRSGTWLRRYNAEPLPQPVFAALLDGSCDAIRIKDSRWGRVAKARLNQVLRTTTR